MISRLALFDIDGTLLTTNGQAVTAMMQGLRATYSVEPAHDGYLMDGKTELRIVHELLATEGLSPQSIEAGLPEFWACYTEFLELRISPEATTVYPGVPELLAILGAHDNVALGLLTGNCPSAARIKLRAAALDHVFAFGAYGELHQDRADLPALALEAANRHLGVTFPGSATVVLGDTPNDILCARPLGLRTVAVATGLFDAGALAEQAPDHLFTNFADPAPVIAAILA